MAEFCKSANFAPLSPTAANDTIGEFNRILASKGTERAANIRNDMQNLNDQLCRRVPQWADMQKAVDGIREAEEAF